MEILIYESVVGSGVSIDIDYKDGKTSLMKVAIKDMLISWIVVGWVRVLIAVDADGVTALMAAADKGHVEVVRKLGAGSEASVNMQFRSRAVPH